MKKIILLTLFGCCFTSLAQQTPMMQTLTGETTITCPQDNTLILGGSEVGFNYYLRNEADDAIVDGPIAGTGAILDFQTGVVSETSGYYVSATNQSFALDFDGQNDTVSIPHGNHLNFSTGLTIEGWINPTDLTISGGYQEIIRKENSGVGRILLSFQQVGAQHILSFGVHTDMGGYIELDVNIDKAAYENQWVHIMATFDNNVDLIENMNLFRNGVQIGGTANDGEIITPPQPSNAYIGSLANSSEFYNGKIASLRIWNKALVSQAEIDAAIANDINGDEPGLVAFYPFNENMGTQLTDLTTYQNHGNITGATWTEVIIGNEEQFTVSNTQTVTFSQVVDTVYVDQNAIGNNDGTSWTDAFTTVTQATDFINNKCLPNENDEIQIAKGIYQEGAEVVNNHPITIKGGYPTGGGAQDIENNPTIIDGNDSHRVLKANHTTGTLYLEGLTIQNGNLITVSGEGGGIFSSNNLILNSVYVIDNSVSSDFESYGGGIYCNGSLFLKNSHVSNNSSFSLTASSKGGGIYKVFNSSLTLINSVVNGNSSFSNLASEGGGIYTKANESVLTNSQITNNSSHSIEGDSWGAGLRLGTGNVRITNSTISYNDLISSDKSSGGAGISSSSNSLIVTNSLITNNLHTQYDLSPGGFINPAIHGEVILNNSTLWKNAFYTEGQVHVIYSNFSVQMTHNNSMSQGNDLSATNGIDATVMGFDPMFVDDENGDYRLQAGSPLMDAGDFNLLPADGFDLDGDNDTIESIPYDLAGYAREFGGNVDIGPYEYGDLIFKDGF